MTQNKLQFWIPEGFAHGFISLKDFQRFNTKLMIIGIEITERSLSWKDPDIKSIGL